MAYQALYRKYRPMTFSDVVGQEHITETLKNELANGKIVHAYLFTGTRGTGKTSCAKILAKAVNCLDLKDGDPCLECAGCKSISDGENTDIVEIDAASNNSVDSIRELRDQVSFTPSGSKYRVYIIDEVHMLTISAFNALLKTLEEPPKHVIFILATTEVHKLPATILSRCQRFDFRRIDTEKICSRIQYIAEKEGLTVTPDAATLIASAADGGMRDALSIFDLCASNNKNIDENVVEDVCAMAGNDYLIKLADCSKTQNTEGALLLLDELHSSSVDMLRLLSELTGHYRDLMIIKTVKDKRKPIVCSASRLKELEAQADNYSLKDIMSALNILQSASAGMQTGNRRCEMEMAMIKLCNPSVSTDIASLEKRVTMLESGVSVKSSAPANQAKPTAAVTDYDDNFDSSPDDEIPIPEYPGEERPSESQPKADNTADTPVENWSDVIKILKSTCPLIAGVLQSSKAYIKGQYLLIDAPNSQFRSLVNSGNSFYRDSIRKAAQTVLGATYKLGPYNASAKAEKDDPLSALADRLKNFEI